MYGHTRHTSIYRDRAPPAFRQAPHCAYLACTPHSYRDISPPVRTQTLTAHAPRLPAMPTAVTARLSATGGRVRSDATAAARAAPVPVPGRRPAATGSFAAARARSGAQRCTGAVGLRRSAAPRQVMTAASFSAALIFDCDGVIVETEELHRLVRSLSSSACGFRLSGN